MHGTLVHHEQARAPHKPETKFADNGLGAQITQTKVRNDTRTTVERNREVSDVCRKEKNKKKRCRCEKSVQRLHFRVFRGLSKGSKFDPCTTPPESKLDSFDIQTGCLNFDTE